MSYFTNEDKTGYNILLVDDDEDFLNLISNYMGSKEGINISTSSEPEKTLSVLSKNDIDCVVSDYNMDKMSGLEMLKAVKNNYGDIIFIMLTGAGDESVASRAISEGVDDYIKKDTAIKDLEMLFKRIKNSVDKDRAEKSTKRVVDRISDGFFALDKGWCFTYVNNQAESILEKSRADLLGQNFWDVFPEAEDTKFQKKYEQAMELQKPIYFEAFYPPLNKWFSVRAYPSSTGLSIYFENIDERKQQEKHMKTRLVQQRTMNDILAMAAEGMDSAELQQNAARMVSDAMDMEYCQLSKFESKNGEMVLAASYGVENPLIGEKISSKESNNQINYSFKKRETLAINDFLKNSEFERTEVQEFLAVRSSITAVIGEYENPWGVLNIFSRKTHRFSESEKEFVNNVANALGTAIENQNQRQELKKYREAINSLDKGVYLLDNQSQILFANTEFERITGYSEEKLREMDSSMIDKVLDKTVQSITAFKTEEGMGIELETRVSDVDLPDGTKGKLVVLDTVEK